MAIPSGFLAWLIVFGRRAERAAYAEVEGRPGAAGAALGILRKGWKVQQAVAVTKNQDLVHRVVGKPGVVLVGEGNVSRVRQLLAVEKKKHARVVGEVPIYDIVVGDGTEETVTVPQLAKHIQKLPRNITPADITDVMQRLRALDAMRPQIPIPKGPDAHERQAGQGRHAWLHPRPLSDAVPLARSIRRGPASNPLSELTWASARARVAVVGSGVSGLTAAYLLRDTADVTLFEASARVGGHVHTHHPTLDDGTTAAVDSGFIVCNDRTYPTLLRLFDELGVAVRPTEMSMGIRCDGCGLQFVGGRGLAWRLRPATTAASTRGSGGCCSAYGASNGSRWRISRDHVDSDGDLRRVPDAAPASAPTSSTTTPYPSSRACGRAATTTRCATRPATSSPSSATTASCRCAMRRSGTSSRAARRRTSTRSCETLDEVVTGTPVTRVTRHDGGVTLAGEAGELGTFDAVVLAAHADETLGDARRCHGEEKDVLGAFTYSRNDAVLHRDESVLPANRAARGGWNYRMPACAARGERVQVSYWMNRLQHHDERFPLVVTLNPERQETRRTRSSPR